MALRGELRGSQDHSQCGLWFVNVYFCGSMTEFYDRVCGGRDNMLNSHVGSTMESVHYNDSVFDEFVQGKALF